LRSKQNARPSTPTRPSGASPISSRALVTGRHLYALTLGRLTLLSPTGDESESLAKRRLKLALLAVLAAGKRPVSRATLAEMFWGDEEECRARHSLSDALSHLRRELGRRAIVSQGGDVSLSPDAPLVVDAALFEDAADERDLPRAAEFYAGPFLDGVDIEAGPSFGTTTRPG
jgi:DNA-binding SARP family transcriptional activator